MQGGQGTQTRQAAPTTQPKDSYTEGLEAGKREKCVEYIKKEAQQGCSMIEQQTFFFKAFHDSLKKVSLEGLS